MKVHDWYLSMQQLIPLCIYGLLYKLTRFAIMCYNYIFMGCIHNWGTKNELLVFKRLQRTTLDFLNLTLLQL
jgi:hypothetical protein